MSDILGCNQGGPKRRHEGKPGHALSDYLKFQDLIDKMLDYNPETRITPLLALQHVFFAEDAVAPE